MFTPKKLGKIVFAHKILCLPKNFFTQKNYIIMFWAYQFMPKIFWVKRVLPKYELG